jgi:acetyltransferase
VTIADAWQGRGLGTELTSRLIDHARIVGFSSMFGLVLRINTGMLALARRLGFTLHPEVTDATIERATLALRD